MPFNLNPCSLSSYPDLDHAFLTSIPQKYSQCLSTAHQEANDVCISHTGYVTLDHLVKLVSSGFFHGNITIFPL